MPELKNPLEDLPPQVYQAVEGLMWLGHIEETYSFCGHTFSLRTLKMSEQLEAALVAKEYLDSLGQIKADAWAQVAAALVAIDGDTNFCPPIGPNNRSNIRAKFRFLVENMYWPVGDYLFSKYTSDLMKRQIDAIEAIEDLSSRSLTTSWPSSDSSGQAEPGQENLTPSSESAPPISSQ